MKIYLRREEKVYALLEWRHPRIAIEEPMSLSGRSTGRARLPVKDIGIPEADVVQDDPCVSTTLAPVMAGSSTIVAVAV
ncbi:hypothetical protein EHS39_20910 [Ensifer sp. MPMI2T]|nr:hypothetical protein EHS39_20910 [Ensifer sp. MPMI2T]